MPKRKFHSVKQNEGQFIYPIHFTLNSIHGFLQILDVTSQKVSCILCLNKLNLFSSQSNED